MPHPKKDVSGTGADPTILHLSVCWVSRPIRGRFVHDTRFDESEVRRLLDGRGNDCPSKARHLDSSPGSTTSDRLHLCDTHCSASLGTLSSLRFSSLRQASSRRVHTSTNTRRTSALPVPEWNKWCDEPLNPFARGRGPSRQTLRQTLRGSVIGSLTVSREEFRGSTKSLVVLPAPPPTHPRHTPHPSR